MPEPTYRIAEALHARRAEVGLCSYGEHLKPFNKRCSLIDAIEESADMLCYLLNMAQESRHLMIDLIANSVRLREAGHTVAADGLDKIIVGMGGKETLAKYDDILGTVAENATVDQRDEAKANHKAHATQVGAVEWVCRCECGWIERYETTGEGAGALCEWHMAKAAPDPRAELAAAKNLLARIHRDGGHHTEAVGFSQSVADAGEKVSEWLLAADELDARDRRMKLIGAAEEFERSAKTLREDLADMNPPEFASRGKVAPGYCECLQDVADGMEERAAQLRREAEDGN